MSTPGDPVLKMRVIVWSGVLKHGIHSGKLRGRWLGNVPGLSRCMDPIEPGDIPAIAM